MDKHIMEEELKAILKSISGDATMDENDTVRNWLQRSSENTALYLQMKNIWEVSGKQLTPADIDVDKALKTIMQEISNREKKHRSWWSLSRIAAAALIPLVAAGYFLGWKTSGNRAGNAGQEIYREVYTAYGTRTHLSLSDGSAVWLNAGSRLLYPDRFEGTRRVILEGEAYFEVESDARHPFIVEAGRLTVEATGTAFNVMASSAGPDIEVTLVEGSVTVNRKDASHKLVPIIELESSQHLVYDTLHQDYDLENLDPYRFISWKDGLLVFRNDPMEEVVKKIGHHYNVDIELHDEELRTYRYRATFENESFEEVMKLLKLSSPIDYAEQERTVMPDGTFTKRKVIIFANP